MRYAQTAVATGLAWLNRRPVSIKIETMAPRFPVGRHSWSVIKTLSQDARETDNEYPPGDVLLLSLHDVNWCSVRRQKEDIRRCLAAVFGGMAFAICFANG